MGDLNHPGLDLTAVSEEVDLGPDRDADHFGGGHDIHRLAAVVLSDRGSTASAHFLDDDPEVT